MNMKLIREMLTIVILSLFATFSEAAWGMKEEKKVKLKDVQILTLYHGKMTTGRRSSPMPQLECVDQGTAPCSSFRPKVVQCKNGGSDGYDIQWECKTDMDNAYRFGEVEVSCEGYDYPDDPYILHGSCGLKYSIDYTEEGIHKKKHNYYGDNQQSGYSSYSYGKKSSSSMSSIIADLIVYAGVGLIVYALYRTCTMSGRNVGQDAYSTTDDDYPSSGGGGGGYGWFGGNNQPPPPYSTHSRYQDDASCRNRYNGGGTGMGGFWTGAATGGLLGYMFGNRQGGWGGRGYGYGNGSYGFGGGGFSGGGGSGSSSSGSRSASGFGGTSRR